MGLNENQTLHDPTGAAPARQSLHLLYHELSAEKRAYSYVVQTSAFAQHAALYARLQHENGLRPELTFDDGHRSNHDLALPILAAHNLQARFFITTSWTGNRPGYMGWDELRALHAAGQHIGAHGATHALLTHCTGRNLESELYAPRLLLEDKLGAPITTMSFPGGRYNHRVLAACQDAGYTHLYTSHPKAEPIPAGDLIGRLNIRGDMDPAWIARLFTPGDPTLAKLSRSYQLKATAKTLLGDRLYAALWAVLNRKTPDLDEMP
jgi:peptidoglycan/xylan/chitin deacetylase (PgdA/CDA1 family)